MPQKIDTDKVFKPSREFTDEERKYHEEICENFEDLFNFVSFRVPNGEAKDQFVARLTEAKMWANTALMLGPDEDDDN